MIDIFILFNYNNHAEIYMHNRLKKRKPIISDHDYSNSATQVSFSRTVGYAAMKEENIYTSLQTQEGLLRCPWQKNHYLCLALLPM